MISLGILSSLTPTSNHTQQTEHTPPATAAILVRPLYLNLEQKCRQKKRAARGPTFTQDPVVGVTLRNMIADVGIWVEVSTVGPSTTLNSQRVTADPEIPAADADTSFASPNQSSSDVTNTAISWPLPVLEPPNFSWGPLEGQEFCDKVNEAYEEVVHWRRNLFQVPSGSAGKA